MHGAKGQTISNYIIVSSILPKKRMILTSKFNPKDSEDIEKSSKVDGFSMSFRIEF